MRAFLVVWRSLVSFYNELFLLLGVNLLWWLTGGFLVGLMAILAWFMLQIGGPWWLAPLLAIPAGPATAALANVMRRAIAMWTAPSSPMAYMSTGVRR